jgi:hypothetical protein
MGDNTCVHCFFLFQIDEKAISVNIPGCSVHLRHSGVDSLRPAGVAASWLAQFERRTGKALAVLVAFVIIAIIIRRGIFQ